MVSLNRIMGALRRGIDIDINIGGDVNADTVDAATVDGDSVVANNSMSYSGNDVARVSSIQTPNPSFGDTRTPSSDRPVIVIVEASAETDSSSEGLVQADVDEDGDGTTEIIIDVVNSPPEAGAGATGKGSATFFMDAGGQYRLLSSSDPNNNNTVGEVKEYVL